MLDVAVIGSGLVGQALGRRLRAAGHAVRATTTTPEKVESIRHLFDSVTVLRGADRDAVAEFIADANAVVVTAGPSAQRAMTVEDRRATYHDVLVGTAESVVAAAGDAPVVALSALSVYGNAADDLDTVDETAPLSTSDDPSPATFGAMERVYLDGAPDRSCIFRCADIFGGDDPPIVDKIRWAHENWGGSVPFQGGALFYRVHVDDVAEAIEWAINDGIRGVYNLAHAEVPATNAALFDAVSADLGYPPLTYRGEIAGPNRPISVQRLIDAGYRPTHTPVER